MFCSKNYVFEPQWVNYMMLIKGPTSFFFMWIFSCPVPFVTKATHSLLTFLVAHVKSQLNRKMNCFFSELLVGFHWSIFPLLFQYHYFLVIDFCDYCFYIWKCEFPKLVFIKIIWLFFVFCFLYQFWNHIVCLQKKTAGILWGIQ